MYSNKTWEDLFEDYAELGNALGVLKEYENKMAFEERKLREALKEARQINEQHRKLNGELREELTKLQAQVNIKEI